MAESTRSTRNPPRSARPGRAHRDAAAPRSLALEPREEEVILHGHRVSYRTAGHGPVVLLIHGITGTSAQWGAIMPLLAERSSSLLACSRAS